MRGLHFFDLQTITELGRYCLGDAVHRHPPMNGLGSNTCIQDAANLAWKVAMVEKGRFHFLGFWSWVLECFDARSAD